MDQGENQRKTLGQKSEVMEGKRVFFDGRIGESGREGEKKKPHLGSLGRSDWHGGSGDGTSCACDHHVLY